MEIDLKVLDEHRRRQIDSNRAVSRTLDDMRAMNHKAINQLKNSVHDLHQEMESIKIDINMLKELLGAAICIMEDHHSDVKNRVSQNVSERYLEISTEK